MTDFFRSALDSWADPHARHALLVHFPVALTVFGVGLAVALAFTRFRSAALRWSCVVCLAVAAGGALLAEEAGEDAHERIHDTLQLSEAEHEAIEAHEELAEGGWRWPALAALLVGLSALRSRKARLILGSLGLAASIGAAGWVAVTGHRGGLLVYRYGLGVPPRGQAVQGSPAAPHEHDEAEGPDEAHEHDGDGHSP